MTLDDIERMDEAMITAEQAASVIGCKPQSLRIQAKENPAWLGFNVTRINNTLYIPREAFLKHMGRDVRRPEDDRA